MNAIKTIMVIDDESEVLEKVKSFLEDEKLNIITVKDSREAIKRMDNDIFIDLMLINTSIAYTDKTAFFSMKPNSKPDIENNDNFLSKPFTKSQLINFIDGKI